MDTIRARYISENMLSPEGPWWQYREEKWPDRKSGALIDTETWFLNDPLARLWIKNDRTLTVETNLPKLIFGNNARLLFDPSGAINLLDEFIGDHVQGVRDTVSDFDYSRIDYCHNFDVGRENIPRYIAAFSRLNLFRNKTLHNEEETISWRSRGRMVRIYNKEREMIASKSMEAELGKGLLRFEVEIKRKSQVLPRILNQRGKKPGPILLREILDADIAYIVLQKHINLLRIDVPLSSLTKAFDILSRSFEGPYFYRLFAFYLIINLFGIARAKKTLATSTYYHYRKQLMDVGLWLACPQAEYLPPLVLPEKEELLAMGQT